MNLPDAALRGARSQVMAKSEHPNTANRKGRYFKRDIFTERSGKIKLHTLHLSYVSREFDPSLALPFT